MPPATRRILGIDFFAGSLDEAIQRVLGHAHDATTEVEKAAALTKPQLLVAPSAPGLAVDFVTSPIYREALLKGDTVLTDSGFLVVLWFLLTGEKLPRHSGLKFLRALLDREELKQPGAVFWVMPSSEEDARNRAWLAAQGFPITPDDVYIAPHYPKGAIHDDDLLHRIQARRPRLVMIAIGGGVQERLGLMLRTHAQGQPTMLCLGAAIAFLTGGQVSIPPWADRLMLGLLFRFLSNPRKFWRRYAEGLRLAPLVFRYRDRLPPLRS